MPNSASSTAGPANAASGEVRSFARIASRQFLRNRLAVAGLVVIAALASVAVWCPLIATNRPYYIRAVFDEEFENAYYSAQDLFGRCGRLENEYLAVRSRMDLPLTESAKAEKAQADKSLAELRDQETLLRARLGELAASLGAAERSRIEAIQRAVREQARRIERRGGNSPAGAPKLAPWTEWQSEIESVADPERVHLLPRTIWPALRSLHALEVFFLGLWFAAALLGIRCIWKRCSVRAAAAAMVLPPLLAAVAWRVAFPPIADARDYRAILSATLAKKQPARAVFAPVPFGENENVLDDANQPPAWTPAASKRPAASTLAPSERSAAGARPHWLGADPNGRDVLARMIYGTRISMLIGIVAVGIYLAIGIVVGAVAGYFRGWVDMCLSRMIEIVICFPALFLLLILMAYMRPNIYTIMAALGLISWTGVARLERGEFLRLVHQDFVMAVRALGGGPVRIIFRHILPNALGPVLVSASFGIAHSILAESTLSFLGFGVPPDQASWGGLLKIGNDRIHELWWMVLFPGIALFLTVTCFNLVGEGLRDATDPRLIE